MYEASYFSFWLAVYWVLALGTELTSRFEEHAVDSWVIINFFLFFLKHYVNFRNMFKRIQF